MRCPRCMNKVSALSSRCPYCTTEYRTTDLWKTNILGWVYLIIFLLIVGAIVS